jgi:hypothetical protein
LPTSYRDQFYLFDPANPPAVNTPVTFTRLTLVDQNDDGDVDRFNGDSVNGSDVTASYPGDTVTIRVGNQNITYRGITFYLANGQRVFTPTDGQVLQNGLFRSSTFVQGQGALQVPQQLIPTCYTPGALILTPAGERRVEDLRPGDLVTTRDRGPRPVIWAGAETVDGSGDFAPVLIRAGAMGNRRDLRVSPQHRMLVRGWRAELFAGQPEVMVAAVHLVNGRTVFRAPLAAVTYVHFMLDRHEIVFAEGAETESLDPSGDAAAADRAILRLVQDAQGRPVRPSARAWEGRALAL